MHTLTLRYCKLLVDPLSIHDTHVERWTVWLQGTKEGTFFDDYHIDWENAQQYWPQFRDYPAHQHISANLVFRIWHAITQPNINNSDTRQEIPEALSQPISIDDLKNAIRKASNDLGPQ